MIYVNNVSVQSPTGDILLNDISLEIPAGRITCLLGPSGAGKTTMLRTIAQLNRNYQGSIIIDGAEDAQLTAQQLSVRLGFVFQQFNLFERLTVLENCALPMQVVKHKEARDASAQALFLLDQLGIVSLANRYPADISGGQQQRVAIARALCLNPSNLLLDEPTSALDPSNAAALAAMLQVLAKKGMAIVVSSQDSSFVQMVLDRAYLLKEGKDVAFYDAQKDRSFPGLLENFLYDSAR